MGRPEGEFIPLAEWCAGGATAGRIFQEWSTQCAVYFGINSVLIITDVMMPIMGGLQMCRLIHEQTAQAVPQIILMSAFALPPQDDKFHYAYFLPKPLRLAQPRDAVQGCIGSADGA